MLEYNIGLLIVDSLSKFWNVKNENDAAEVERELKPLVQIARDTNAAVLLIHHNRKNEKGDGLGDARGSIVSVATAEIP